MKNINLKNIKEENLHEVVTIVEKNLKIKEMNNDI